MFHPLAIDRMVNADRYLGSGMSALDFCDEVLH